MFRKSLEAYLVWGIMSLTIIQGALELPELQLDIANNFTDFLEKVYIEKKYETLVLLRYNQNYCFDENFEYNIKWPVFLLDEKTNLYLKSSYNSELLMLLCLPVLDLQMDIENMIQLLITNLRHIRTARIVVFVNEDIEASATELVEFFKVCEENKLLNVVLLQRSSFETGNYYSFTQFPVFQLQYRTLTDATEVFPDLLLNFQGKTVLTLPDNLPPRYILYNDKQGQQQIAGYMGKLMQTFSNKYNCVLKYPFPLRNDEIILLLDVRQFARNGTVDIGITISAPQRDMKIHDFSNVIQIVQLVTLWPIENEIPTYELLVSVFRVELWGMIFFLGVLLSILLIKLRKRNARLSTKLLDFVLNDISLRGVLGQSFNMPPEPSFNFKLVCIIISIAGLVNVTMYSSHLVDLLAEPPLQQRIASFDDVLKQDKKIIVTDQDEVAFRRGQLFYEKYKSIFEYRRFQDQVNMIRKLDTRYGYMYVSTTWPIIHEQQRCFARKLFRLSTELYYYENLLAAMPVNENSYYKEPLNRLILQLQDAGIFNYWMSLSFYEMVAIKLMTFKDLSTARVHGALSVVDFYWIWMLYIFLVGLSLIVFLVEKIIYRKMRRSKGTDERKRHVSGWEMNI